MNHCDERLRGEIPSIALCDEFDDELDTCPFLRGGQGRSASDVQESGRAIFLLMIGAVSGIVVCELVHWLVRLT